MPQNTNALKIDELKARRAELRAQRDEIVAEMEAGTLVDKFPLFFCNEEIRSVNAQLRSYARKKKTATKVFGDGDFAIEKKLYHDWEHQDEDEAIDEYHAEMKRAAQEAASVLTAKQAFYFSKWADGISMADIARADGVAVSTVSVCISRAKKRIRREFELRNAIPSEEEKHIDLADEDVLRLVMSLLTPHQAVCMYLYYGEWLTIRDCESILSIDHSTVYRTIQRGLTSICEAMNCRHVLVENIDIIGDLAYECYIQHAESMGRDEILPKSEWRAKIASKEKRKEWKRKKLMTGEELRCSISVMDKNGKKLHGIRNRSGELREPGKLLSLLIKAKDLEKIRSILLGIFKKLCGRKSR